MPTKKHLTARVGLFIFLAFILFIAGILILGRQQSMFQQTIRVTTVFKDVKGLEEGNNVRFSGIEVGAVTKISILSDTSVIVEFSLGKDVIPYIKKNSRASIGSEGLMGNKTVVILPGTPGSESIKEGDRLPSINPVEIDDIMRDIQKSSEKISEVAHNLSDITNKINRGEGIFGKVFIDTKFSEDIDETSKNLAELTGNLVEITEKIQNGEGMVGKLFTDTLFSKQLDVSGVNIAAISTNLLELTNKINRGEGVFGKLLADTMLSDNFYDSGKNIERIIENLTEVSNKLNDERNVLNRFIADTAFADSVVVLLNRINTGVVEVTEASEALQRSGFVRAFSKDEDKKSRKNETKNTR